MSDYAFSSTSLNPEVQNGVNDLEGRYRPSRLPRPDFQHLLSELQFIRLTGLGRFWNAEKPEEAAKVMEDRMQSLLAGLAASQSQAALVITGHNQKLTVYLGALSGNLAASILVSQFPGAAYEKSDVVTTGLQDLRCCMCLAGIPAMPPDSQKTEPSQESMDRLVRGLMSRDHWALVIYAVPLDPTAISKEQDHRAEEVRRARVQYQLKNTVQENDRLAAHYVELLETNFKRALEGAQIGTWDTLVAVLSGDESAGALAVAALSCPGAIPEPLRAYPCQEGGWRELSDDAITRLTSRELSCVFQFPVHEYPGYAVKQVTRFDVALLDEAPSGGVSLGYVQSISGPTGDSVFVNVNDLVGHLLIAGTTDSGKTNTGFHILEQLSRNEKHFLVIEPTKGEYRNLKYSRYASSQNSLEPDFRQLTLFTMGSPEAPMQINPFYVPPGVSVQTHLDMLQSLFSASFVLYAPMPYVLEAALHEIYQDKGWDLTSGLNWRDPKPGPRAYPTLTELYNKIEGVVLRLGYEERVTLDVKAALRARINSLRIGGKGAMLDSQQPFDMDALLNQDAVIEMGGIGDDDQKAFLIGLLLVRLFEHYLAAGVQAGRVQLKHITVIEEAHRLLQNTPTSQGGDFANPRGKAVETFANMISEIRGYGEGFVIIEQSPVKLAPDVLKNTNFKLAHRIISGDDREALARVMNLDEKGQESLVSLRKGYAVLFQAGMDRPMLVKFGAVKDKYSPPEKSEQTARAVTSTAALKAQLIVNPEVRSKLAGWLLRQVSQGSEQSREAARGLVVSRIGASTPVALRSDQDLQALASSVFLGLAGELAGSLGRFYSWDFALEAELETLLKAAWNDRNQAGAVKEFFDSHTQVAPPPFVGCQQCPSACRYRPLVQQLLELSPEDSGEIRQGLESWNQLGGNPGDFDILALTLARIFREVIEPHTVDRTGILLCAAVQTVHHLHWPVSLQEKFVTGLWNSLAT